jgi:alkylation response protein AidB-like acyl-CoA dehydrogenase
MTAPAHPSAFIPAEYTNAIRSTSAEAEKTGSLHPQQLSIIYAQQWFNLFVPKTMGGLQLPLPEALTIEEALAWADGSTGWTVTLCSGANWFAGFLNTETAGTIFSNSKVCLAGSGRPSGIATVTPNGYTITGRWHYATGTPHATAFTANCAIEKDGAILKKDDGSPLIYSFIFLKDEVTVYNDWNTTGMIATASYSFEVTQLQVPANRCFMIDAAHAVLQEPIYQYPFLQFAEATLAVNSSGMAVRFIDLCETLFDERRRQKNFTVTAIGIMYKKLENAKGEIQIAREAFYAAVQQSWNGFALHKNIGGNLPGKVSNTSRALAETSRRLVDELYPYCGLTAASQGTEINRVWRNLHTASQHSLLTLG